MLHHGFDDEGQQDEPLNGSNDNHTDEEERPHGFEDENSQEPEQERALNQRKCE